MTERTFDMDTDDWERIEGIVNRAIKPIETRLDDLPCVDHALQLNTIEIGHKMEKEQKKESQHSRDWILRIAVGVMAVLVFLDKMGVFRTVQK